MPISAQTIQKVAPSARHLLLLANWHEQAKQTAIQEARRIHNEHIRTQQKQAQSKVQQPQKLIVRVPTVNNSQTPQAAAAAHNLQTLASAADDPKDFTSDYGYTGLKPYELCTKCNRKFQVQPNGLFGAAHSKYCDGLPPSAKTIKKRPRQLASSCSG